MIMTEYNEELHNRTLQEDGRAAERKEGHEELTRAMAYLFNTNRETEVQRLAYDEEFREQIIKESK